MYKWTTDDEEMATCDSEGTVTTHKGPGSFTVRAAMIKGEDNYDEAKVSSSISMRAVASQTSSTRWSVLTDWD